MGRPRKGEPGYEEATKKWRKTMLKKCGGKKSLHEHMVEMGRKGGINGRGPGYKGGFASDHELAKRAGAIGGRISRRTKKVEK